MRWLAGLWRWWVREWGKPQYGGMGGGGPIGW
jgi:hypothetical protein